MHDDNDAAHADAATMVVVVLDFIVGGRSRRRCSLRDYCQWLSMVPGVGSSPSSPSWIGMKAAAIVQVS